MWEEGYEALNSNEKNEFRRIGNYLLSHTYLGRYSYNAGEQMTAPNRDYQIAARFFPLLYDYFAVTGWRLEKDEAYGYMSLTNIYDHNRYRLDQFTTLFLYTCRLIYEEEREQASSFHTVVSSTSDVIQKMSSLGLLKGGKTTQKERLEAQRALAHFNVIEKMDAAAWDPDGNRILILPAILAIVSNQGINDMLRELEEAGFESGEWGASPTIEDGELGVEEPGGFVGADVEDGLDDDATLESEFEDESASEYGSDSEDETAAGESEAASSPEPDEE